MDQVTFDFLPKGEWIVEIDTGTRMLKCSECENRVIEEPYLRAIGTKARRCPYCGTLMRNGKIVEWPHYRLGVIEDIEEDQ